MRGRVTMMGKMNVYSVFDEIENPFYAIYYSSFSFAEHVAKGDTIREDPRIEQNDGIEFCYSLLKVFETKKC